MSILTMGDDYIIAVVKCRSMSWDKKEVRLVVVRKDAVKIAYVNRLYLEFGVEIRLFNSVDINVKILQVHSKLENTLKFYTIALKKTSTFGKPDVWSSVLRLTETIFQGKDSPIVHAL